MNRFLTLLLLVALAAPVAAQETLPPPGIDPSVQLTDKQIRQRLTYQRSQMVNSIRTIEAAIAHLDISLGAINARIKLDSLAAARPDSSHLYMLAGDMAVDGAVTIGVQSNGTLCLLVWFGDTPMRPFGRPAEWRLEGVSDARLTPIGTDCVRIETGTVVLDLYDLIPRERALALLDGAR